MKPYWVPTAADIDRFLLDYSFEPDSLVERVEIRKDGIFEFMMLAVYEPQSETIRLIVMWPNEEKPYQELT